MSLSAYVASRDGHVNSSLDLLSPDGAGGRGVVALADVKKGENLVFVPIEACLFVPKQQDSSSTPAALFLRDYCEKHSIPPFAAAVALLLAEIAAGDKSPHAPFISSLPFGGAVVDDDDGDDQNEPFSPPLTKCLDCTLAWRPQELALLDGTSAHDEGGGARRMFVEVMLPLFSAAASKEGENHWPAPLDSFASFVRAACLVQSRAFHLRATNWATGQTSDEADGGTLYLVPAIDQVNHGASEEERSTALERVSTATTTTATTTTSATIAAATKAETTDDGASVDCFCMRADRDIKKGEEVFHGYGDSLSDAELLTTYGFVPPPRSRTSRREDGKEEEEEEHVSANPCNRAALPSQLLVDAAAAVVSGKEKKRSGSSSAGKGEASKGVAERAEALAKAGALGGSFAVSLSDPMPDALFGAAALLCLGRVGGVGGDGDEEEGGENDDDDGDEEEEESAEALWEEAKGDLLSVARALGPEEALESAPEIAYAAALAIERAASRALESLEGKKSGGEEKSVVNDDDDEVYGDVDAVFERRAALASTVRAREATLMRLLRRAAVEAAAAAAEAMAEEEKEEEDDDDVEEEEDDDDDDVEEDDDDVAARDKGKDKRAAAPSKGSNDDEKRQKRARK